MEWGCRILTLVKPLPTPIQSARVRATQPVELVAIGVDHATAEVELRERIAFASAELPAALRLLANPAKTALEQAAILSTCNRVELYGVARTRLSRGDLAAWLARYHGIEPCELSRAAYFHRGGEVARHLAATAAGTRSLALGETQIMGQVRTALEYALRSGTAGPELRRLFESAIAAARRVRAETVAHRDGVSRPMLLIDLAVPRDVDPEVASLAGVELHTIDDLEPVVQGALAQRRAEFPAADSILRGEVARFTRWLSAREALDQRSSACRSGLREPPASRRDELMHFLRPVAAGGVPVEGRWITEQLAGCGPQVLDAVGVGEQRAVAEHGVVHQTLIRLQALGAERALIGELHSRLPEAHLRSGDLREEARDDAAGIAEIE